MNQPYQPPQQHITVNVAHPPSNGLGTAGFAMSVVGWATCGFLCPIGLLLSFFGLFKAPRGTAIAGFILGGLGSLWLVVFGFTIVVGFLGFGKAIEDVSKRNADMRRSESEKPPVKSVETSAQPAVEFGANDPINSAAEAVNDLPITAHVDPPNPIKPVEPAAPPVKAANSKARKWSSADGQFTIEAEYVNRIGDKVRLRRTSDGKVIEVSIDKLSDDDRAYAEHPQK